METQIGKQHANINLPRVYDYLDYREYLRDFYAVKKKTDSRFSYGSFAIKAKIQTRNYLKRIIDGERPVSIENLPKICRGLNLDPKESHYFESLVHYNQSKDNDIKVHYFEQLKESVRGVKNPKIEVALHQYDIYKHWYTLAVYEALFIKDIDGQESRIQKRFRYALTNAQIRESLKTLESLDFVKSQDGKWHPTAPILINDRDVVNLAIQDFYKQIMDLNKVFIDTEPIDVRDCRSLNIAVSRDAIPEIKQKLKKFIREINENYSALPDNKKQELIQINTQVLQITKGEKK